jgi:HlyD family secretion protein
MSAPAEGEGQTDTARSLRNHVRLGLAVLLLLVGGFGGWAATTQISGAVIAAGRLVVDSNVKKVQHPSGGIVNAIEVRNGDIVKAGDRLMRLDPTVTRANLSIVASALDQLHARTARLLAERDGVDALTFPEELLARAKEPGVESSLEGEANLFAVRRQAQVTQRSQLAERISQLREEILGLEGQSRSKDDEIVLVQKELVGVRALWERRLVELNRVTALEREAARLQGDRARLIATIAQTRGRIAEIKLQISRIGQDHLTEVNKELREAESKTGELEERKVAAEDQLRRIDILAPQSGVVHELAVHTVGGVVSAGETLMMIVPEADRLLVEAKVAPSSIDQLHLGQKAGLRFTSFDQRTTPEIEGRVALISADTTTDLRTAESHYDVRIAIEESELARLGAERVVPGMPVEVFVRTGERSVLSYLSKPLRDQMARTFRER